MALVYETGKVLSDFKATANSNLDVHCLCKSACLVFKQSIQGCPLIGDVIVTVRVQLKVTVLNCLPRLVQTARSSTPHVPMNDL